MIIQVGIYPPPIGGVSIYSKRFKEFMDEKRISNELWDTSTIKKNVNNVKNYNLRTIPYRSLINTKSRLIHYNIPGKWAKEYVGGHIRLLPDKKIKILTHHGDSPRLFKDSTPKLVKALNAFDAIICVKKNDSFYMREKGVKTKLFEIPAFIPPVVKESDIEQIPEYIYEFIKNHSPLISANAANINLIDGKDLYGMENSVEAIIKLKNDFPNIGLLFFRPYKNIEFYEKINKMIHENKLEKNILIVNDILPFYPIIMKSDLFIRPTLTDGDAVSIREALYFKIPVLTSNVVERPEGSILYDNSIEDDFYKKLHEILSNVENYKLQSQKYFVNNNAEEILKVYQNFIELESNVS